MNLTAQGVTNPIPSGLPISPMAETASWSGLEVRTDVWRATWAEIRHFAPLFGPLLSPSEQKRAARFQVAAAREAFILRRSLLRLLLSLYVRERPAAFAFSETPGAKPEVCDLPGFDFSISSSRNLVFLALSRGRRVGVDVETAEASFNFLPVAERFFPASEFHRLLSLPFDEARQEFFALWTRKEAYLKACGLGLRGLTKDLETPLGLDFPILTRSQPATEDHPCWQLVPLPAGPGDHAALCISHPVGGAAEFCLFSAAVAGRSFELR